MNLTKGFSLILVTIPLEPTLQHLGPTLQLLGPTLLKAILHRDIHHPGILNRDILHPDILLRDTLQQVILAHQLHITQVLLLNLNFLVLV